MHPDTFVEFPPFRLDLANQELWRDSERLQVRGKPFAVLAYLATHPARLVPREELARAVWPDTHVGEGLLRGYVRELRAILGDDPAVPRFIETVARRGYRFVAPVRSRSERAAGAARAERARRTLVGRDAELEQLERCFEDAKAGARGLVFVSGEAGIGKTALVDAFLRGAEADGVRAARGQCVEHFGAGEAYLPLLEALGRLGGQPGSKDVIAGLARHAPTWLVELPALVADAELEAVRRRVQGATRERMLRELAEAVEVLTAAEPLLLVLEDLQWSDHSTLDLLSSLARRREPARLLVIGTYRTPDVARGVHPLAAVAQELK
ncbi:MAG TPA: AAA family ATPase, partial [Myxococcota bacterium]|nr:AAA family ATPase [Myxococcota bacterium]